NRDRNAGSYESDWTGRADRGWRVNGQRAQRSSRSSIGPEQREGSNAASRHHYDRRYHCSAAQAVPPGGSDEEQDEQQAGPPPPPTPDLGHAYVRHQEAGLADHLFWRHRRRVGPRVGITLGDQASVAGDLMQPMDRDAVPDVESNNCARSVGHDTGVDVDDIARPNQR